METKIVSGVTLTLLMITALIPNVAIPVRAEETVVFVINPETGDNNFVFSTHTTAVGSRFNATIWVRDVVDLFAFQVYLTVNDTLLNITRAWVARWDPQYIFYGRRLIRGVVPVFDDLDGDGSREAVMHGDSLLATSGVSGTGKLAVIEFEIIYAPTVGNVSDILHINGIGFSHLTYLLDSSLNEIPTLRMDGSYTYARVPDVAVTSVVPSATEVYVGQTVNVTAVVENIGHEGITENFLVTCKYELEGVEHVIETKAINNLASKTNITLTFTWTTTDVTVHTIKVEASTVPDELDTTNNDMTSPITVKVKMLGDVNGDDKIDIKDIAQAALAFGTCPNNPRWNIQADINQDNKIDIRDLALIATHFGETYP